MLKTLLACLLTSVVASPTLPPGVPLVGMSRKQIEAILGEPSGRSGFHVGQLSNAGLTSETYEYDSVTVEFSYGTVTRVTFTR